MKAQRAAWEEEKYQQNLMRQQEMEQREQKLKDI